MDKKIGAASAACALLAAAPAMAQQAMQDMPGMAMPMPAHEARSMTMTGALGPYPMNREASGTAWQPDASPEGGVPLMTGGWMLMGHALLNGVYDWQSGPRGGERGFVSGMVMGMAQRGLAGGTLQLRAMLSPEPLMGARGYPLLLASGETADGVTPLVDRQHPHDLFMELSASYSLRLSGGASAFVYAGLPGEPAFGPPAFMHRLSILDSPEAPISHHWLDSTHVSFGVVTAGLVLGAVKLEASRFNGREPDQHRWDIETGPLDSTAARISWNPTRQSRAAGELGASGRPRAARAGQEFDALVGERDLHARPRPRRLVVDHPRLGPPRRRRRGRSWKAPPASASGRCSAAPNGRRTTS